MSYFSRGILYFIPILMLLMVGGCAASDSPESTRGMLANSASLLYLKSTPYQRIYLEIDSVEGSEPDDRSIGIFLDFLKKYTEKPITVVKKAPIPHSLAKECYPEFLALQNIQGPEDAHAGQSTAYIYMLFYNSKKGKQSQSHHGYIRYSYPCAIYIDMGKFESAFMRNRLLPSLLMHEAGHVLGLCVNKECLTSYKVALDGREC